MCRTVFSSSRPEWRIPRQKDCQLPIQADQLREQEERARAAATEKEAVRRLIKQLPRPTMAARTDASVTLAMRRLAYGKVRRRLA